MMIAMMRKDAAMVGNHQPWLITPHTMMGKAAAKRIRMTFCFRSNGRMSSSAVSSCHCALNFSRSS